MSNWVKRKCAYCGATFTALSNSHKVYCCGSCRKNGQRKRTEETKQRKEPIVKSCPICKTEFTAPDHRRVYCSRDCYLEANRKNAYNRMKRSSTELQRCIVCGQVLEGHQLRYCSPECAYASRFKTYGEKIATHYLDVTAGADETANTFRCECKMKQSCIYGRCLGGGTTKDAGYMYCAYMELTGEVRGGFPDECTHYQEKKRRRSNGA